MSKCWTAFWEFFNKFFVKFGVLQNLVSLAEFDGQNQDFVGSQKYDLAMKFDGRKKNLLISLFSKKGEEAWGEERGDGRFVERFVHHTHTQ